MSRDFVSEGWYAFSRIGYFAKMKAAINAICQTVAIVFAQEASLLSTSDMEPMFAARFVTIDVDTVALCTHVGKIGCRVVQKRASVVLQLTK